MIFFYIIVCTSGNSTRALWLIVYSLHPVTFRGSKKKKKQKNEKMQMRDNHCKHTLLPAKHGGAGERKKNKRKAADGGEKGGRNNI